MNHLKTFHQTGFSFLMDYNEDRQVTLEEEKLMDRIKRNLGKELHKMMTQKKDGRGLNSIRNAKSTNAQASIHLDTIGN